MIINFFREMSRIKYSRNKASWRAECKFSLELPDGSHGQRPLLFFVIQLMDFQLVEQSIDRAERTALFDHLLLLLTQQLPSEGDIPLA
jgi:hypothetical protein